MGRLCRNPCRDLCRSRVKRECGRIGVGVPASAVLVHLLFRSNLVSNPGLACTSTCTRTNGNTPHALLGGAGRRRGGTDLLAKHFPQGRAGPARRRATRRSRVGTPQPVRRDRFRSGRYRRGYGASSLLSDFVAGITVGAVALPLALAFGAEDYTTSMGIERTKTGEELFQARNRVVWAAKAAGIQALDSIFADVNDMDALRAETELIKKLGFTGKSLVNPRQIDVVHEVFAPKQAEVDYALQVMDAIKRAREMGTGVISLKGKMIDRPVVVRAARVLSTARAHGMVDVVINEEDINGAE